MSVTVMLQAASGELSNAMVYAHSIEFAKMIKEFRQNKNFEEIEMRSIFYKDEFGNILIEFQV